MGFDACFSRQENDDKEYAREANDDHIKERKEKSQVNGKGRKSTDSNSMYSYKGSSNIPFFYPQKLP